MALRPGKRVTLAITTILVFAAVIFVFDQLLPGPRRPTDYLVIGTLATFAALGVVFVVVFFDIATPDKKKQEEQPPETPPSV